MASHHPCGALPVTHVSVSLSWCHHHQAWFGTAAAYRQTAEDELLSIGSTEFELGPFDDDGQALELAQRKLAEMLRSRLAGDGRP